MNFINEDIKKNYSEESCHEFRYQWLIIVLYEEWLPRKDMLAFLKHYGMRFFGINWKNRIKLEEMGRVLLNDVEEDEIFVFLSNYLKEKYPKLFSFEEACKIFDALFYLKNEIQIMEVWLNMADESPYVSLTRELLDNLKKQREKGEFDESPSMEEKREEMCLFRRTAQDIILALYELAMKSYLKNKYKVDRIHLYGDESSKDHDDSAAVKCMQEYLSRTKFENDSSNGESRRGK